MVENDDESESESWWRAQRREDEEERRVERRSDRGTASSNAEADGECRDRVNAHRGSEKEETHPAEASEIPASSPALTPLRLPPGTWISHSGITWRAMLTTKASRVMEVWVE